MATKAKKAESFAKAQVYRIQRMQALKKRLKGEFVVRNVELLDVGVDASTDDVFAQLTRRLGAVVVELTEPSSVISLPSIEVEGPCCMAVCLPTAPLPSAEAAGARAGPGSDFVEVSSAPGFTSHILERPNYSELDLMPLFIPCSTIGVRFVSRARKSGGTWRLVAFSCTSKEHGLSILNEARRIAEIDTPTANGATILQLTAWRGNEQKLRELIDRGADVNGTSNATRLCTPLHVAARAGHAHIIDALLAAGADLSRRNSDGDTALHVAARRGLLRPIQSLLNADTRLRNLGRKNVRGKRPRDLVKTGPQHIFSVFDQAQARKHELKT